MDNQEEQAPAGAQQPIDFASMVESLEAARIKTNAMRVKHHDEVRKLKEANATQAQELLELKAAHRAQVQDFEAALADQSNAYSELQNAHEQAEKLHSAQARQLTSLNAKVVQLKADNQMATQKVASLKSAVSAQLQTYKNLKVELADMDALQDEQSKVLIQVNAVKNVQAQELAELRAAHQVKIQELAQFNDVKETLAAFEAMHGDERSKVVALSAVKSEQERQLVNKSAELEDLSRRYEALGEAYEKQRIQLSCVNNDKERQAQELHQLRGSYQAQVQRVTQLEALNPSGVMIPAGYGPAYLVQAPPVPFMQLHFPFNEVAYLRSVLDSWINEARTLRTASANDAARYSDLRIQYDNLNASFSNLRSRNNADWGCLNAAYAKLQTEKDDLNARCEHLSQENAKLNSDYNRLHNDVRNTAQPGGHADQFPLKKRRIEESYGEPWRSEFRA